MKRCVTSKNVWKEASRTEEYRKIPVHDKPWVYTHKGRWKAISQGELRTLRTTARHHTSGHKYEGEWEVEKIGDVIFL